MEFWVRSQDKMVLTRNVGIRIVLEQEGASLVDETNDYILGMYNTEERALEVLDEIHQRLIDLQTIEYTGDYRFTKRNLDCVYEMPKE